MTQARRLSAFGFFGPLLLSACATSNTSAPACAGYCVTQEEGYQWAQRANLMDARVCDGYAAAFADGCRQAVSDAQLSADPRKAY